MIRTLALIIMAALLTVACATTQEEPAPPIEEAPVAEVPEPVRPAPEPTPVVQKVEPVPPAPVREYELPQTASPIPMAGLAGLGSMGLAGALHLVRRRL